MCKDKKSVADLIKSQIQDKLLTSFPNVNIAFRIYLSIIGANAEGERSFSKLKQIKNYIRSTMNQDRLSSLAVLCIESDLTRDMNFDDIIEDFSKEKCRKKIII